MSFFSLSLRWVCSFLRLDEVPLRCRTKFPHPGRNCPKSKRIGKRKFDWIFMRSQGYSCCKLVCYWSRVSTNQYQFVLVESRWQNRVSKRACTSYIPVWMNFPHTTPYPPKIRQPCVADNLWPQPLDLCSKRKWEQNVPVCIAIVFCDW